MINVSIKINRPLNEVWNYFTTISNWSNWHGGEIIEAEWKKGGYVTWKMGDSSQITNYKYQKIVTLSGRWMDTSYCFSPEGKKTQVTIVEGSPKGGASFNDGGYNETKRLEASLAKLKTLIESAENVEEKKIGFFDFLKRKPKPEELFQAVKNGDIELVRKLILKGANVNAKTDSGLSVLMCAAVSNTDTVKILLENGVDVNAKDNDLVTALMMASRFGYTETVKLLLKNRAKIDEKANDGNTALMLASYEGQTEIVKILLANGANVNAKANNNATSLIVASLGGHIKTVEVLLGNGADVNAKASGERSALMVASMQGHREIVDLLKRGGAV